MGLISRWDSRWECRIPSSKIISKFGRICRCCDTGAVVLCDGSDCTSSVRVEGEGVWVYCPLCCICHISCRHSRWNSRIPTSERVSFFSRISWWSDGSIVVLCDYINYTSACCIKCESILIYCPLCCICRISCWHSRWNCRTPSCERISFSGRISW